MKKILLYMGVLALAIVSCKPIDPVRIYANTAAQDAAGQYTGTWTMTSTKNSDTLYFECPLTLSVYQDSLPNQCFVEMNGLNGKDYRGLANVAHAGDDIIFNNENGGGNGIGSPFFGRIAADGTTTMRFSAIKASVKGSSIETYIFAGQKVTENQPN